MKMDKNNVNVFFIMCLHFNQSSIGFDKWNITIKYSMVNEKRKKNNEAPLGINITYLDTRLENETKKKETHKLPD